MNEITEQMVRAYDDGCIECWGQPDHGLRIVDCCRRAGLAAAAPLIAAAVRQATADEIKAEIQKYRLQPMSGRIAAYLLVAEDIAERVGRAAPDTRGDDE